MEWIGLLLMLFAVYYGCMKFAEMPYCDWCRSRVMKTFPYQDKIVHTAPMQLCGDCLRKVEEDPLAW